MYYIFWQTLTSANWYFCEKSNVHYKIKLLRKLHIYIYIYIYKKTYICYVITYIYIFIQYIPNNFSQKTGRKMYFI